MTLARLSFILVSICLIIIIGCGSQSSSSTPSAKPFVDWAKSNAVVLKTTEPGSGFEDLNDFGDMVGSARVVALGESRHDAREQFRMKHRLIEYLVVEKGFTLFAMEEGMPYGETVNRYILGGEGKAEEILNGMGAWYIWDTDEILDLLNWLREYNTSVTDDKKVRFCGLDIVDPYPGLVEILDYLDIVDPRYFSDLRKRQIGMELFHASTWMEIIERYQSIPAEEVDVLKLNIAEMIEKFYEKREVYISESSSERYESVYRQALTVKQANDMFTTFVRSTFEAAGDIRERGMTGNILWHLDRYGNDSRMIVWAHNFHVLKGKFDLNIPNRPVLENLVPMGQYTSQELGDQLISVGFSFYEDSAEDRDLPVTESDMIDAALHDVGKEFFAIDLRRTPVTGDVSDWLSNKRKHRGEGGFVQLIPTESFDVLIFTRSLTRTTPSELARERFDSMR